MDCKKEVGDTIAKLYLKHQLIYMTPKEMMEIYKDLESYTDFLYTAIDLITEETAYFYLQEFLIEKIMIVTNKFRFDYIKEPEINDLVNKIILSANNIKFNMNNMEYVGPLIANYVLYQSDMRKINFEDDIELLTSIGQDYAVFYGLANKDETMYKEEFFLMSTNYFLNCCEEIYEYPEVKEESERKLKSLSKSIFKTNPIIKQYADETKKIFKKIK